MSSERQVAVITGASQRMSAALVEAYRDRDYAMVATARSIRPINDGQILAAPGDITDPKTAAISKGLDRSGRIDTLTKKETHMSSERKVAVITGASQGMGAALVEAYRDRDYAVVATARSIRPTNDNQILVVPGDITDRKTAERAISEGVARFGRIDTLINNAGVFVARPFTQYTEADYAAVLSVNLTGFFHITQLAIAEMEKQHSGHVVQITTSLVEHANSQVPSVLASLTKGGLSAATRSLAIEYAKLGIRVNAVAPGVIKTPMHAVESYAQLAKLHPLGRMGEISDIVGAILYLESAGFVTGETIHVDGGQSAGH